MNFVLDTDTLIYFLKGKDSVVENLAKQAADNIYTTIINQAELLYGAFNSAHQNHNLEIVKNFLDKIQVLEFCNKSAYIFAEHKASLKKKGSLIADMDLIIASISLANRMTLVTNNEKHFKRISKLKLDNWTR